MVLVIRIEAFLAQSDNKWREAIHRVDASQQLRLHGKVRAGDEPSESN